MAEGINFISISGSENFNQVALCHFEGVQFPFIQDD
jgi:hypothetical protein